MRKSILPVLILLLTACTTNATPVPTPSETDLAAEEQAVYIAVLNELIGSEMYVLVDKTASIQDYSPERLNIPSDEITTSYIESNQTSTSIPENLYLGVDYVLVSQEQLDNLFDYEKMTTNGWEAFYENYPQAPGIIKISHVGFNSDLSQAMLYLEWWEDWEAGGGYLIMAKKTESGWEILSIDDLFNI